MMRWIAFALMVGLTACQLPQTTQPASEAPIPPPTPVQDEWSQITTDGVTLSVQVPDGWQSMVNERGILLAEHAEIQDADAPRGIVVGVFVPEMRDVDMEHLEHENLAWAVLDHVTKLPAYVGDSTVSETMPIRIGEHDGAYYLLSDSEGNRTLVLALFLSNAGKLVVCNVSGTARDAQRIRAVLPEILSNITINGTPVPEEDLEALPTRLEFPRYRTQVTEAPSPVSNPRR